MANIEITITIEDFWLLNAFINWAERNSIKYTKIHDAPDHRFKINGEDFNSFIYEYFFIKVDV